MPSSHLFIRRFGSAAFVVWCFSAGAMAQLPNTDQFQQMRTNAGEQMQQRTPDLFNRYGTMQPQTTIPFTYRQYLTLIPPLPPGLGDDLPYADYAGTSILPASEFSREIFYGPYAALVREKKVPAKLTDEVANYGRERDALVREIDAKLTILRTASPDARRVALAELAKAQADRLQALSGEAETIRGDLTRVRPTYDFLARPAGARLVEYRYDESAQESLRLLEAVYHYPGLSLEQRQLLPEIAFETTVWDRDNSPRSGNDHAGLLFFLPATARIRIPTDISPSLGAKIQSFADEKEALKAELRAAVLRESHRFSFHRAQRLSALADAQAPRFAALETLADEIRVELMAYCDAEPATTGVRGKTVEPLPATSGLTSEQREKWNRYRDYVRAVLEPGLSPAQRRLLFQFATENLDRAGWLPRRS